MLLRIVLHCSSTLSQLRSKLQPNWMLQFSFLTISLLRTLSYKNLRRHVVLGLKSPQKILRKRSKQFLKRIRIQYWRSVTELMRVNYLDMSGKICHGQILRL